VAAVMAVAITVEAGPWSRLPEAVAQLQQSPEDGRALQVLEAVERSLIREARAGHLTSVSSLVETYDELVFPIPGGENRISAVHRRIARALTTFGDRVEPSDPMAAGVSWTLASEVDADSPAIDRLRKLILPPVNPRGGQVWTSPIDGSTLVWLPSFRFLMGCTRKDGDCAPDEKYLRWVTVPGFWVDRTEVTNGEYQRCVRAGACTPPADALHFADPERASFPVVGVTWPQAEAYLRWAGRRLPSEAEFERAARGRRTDWRLPWGNSKARGRANLQGTSGQDVFPEAAPVGSFNMTGWGVYDLAGNVWEWCQDSYHKVMVAGPKDGAAWIEGGLGRVVRGGSWRRTIDLARVSARAWHEEWYRADDLGFRGVVSSSESVDDADLLAVAREVFRIVRRPGYELRAAALDPADRRYLERRAVTWLMVEGRSWEALPGAVALMLRDVNDPVAESLLDHLETRFAKGVRQESLHPLKEALDEYRALAAGDAALKRRLASVNTHLARALVSAGRETALRGDDKDAVEYFRLALIVEPDNAAAARLLRSLAPKPGAIREWEGDGRTMVWIPPGRFLMGRGRGDDEAATDEQPAHTVRVKGFWMDRTEVTNADYRRCVASGACSPPAERKRFDDPASANDPVLWVNWFQARAYARWAGKRLPTEAEWEYAARAGRTTRFPWGNEWRGGMVNNFGATGKDRWSGASPVGSFPANRWGLVDMLGNAWEWVEDVYHESYVEAPVDGRAWNQVSGGPRKPKRVLRGGSYLDFPPKLRFSRRESRSPDSWSRTTGFRCAADG